MIPIICLGLLVGSGQSNAFDGMAWSERSGSRRNMSRVVMASQGMYSVIASPDTIATPAALIAGTLVSAAVMADLPPLIK